MADKFLWEDYSAVPVARGGKVVQKITEEPEDVEEVKRANMLSKM